MAIVKGKVTFKKLAMGAALAGLIAVPSFVAAQATTSDSTTTSTTAATAPSTTTGTSSGTTTSATTGTTVVATPTVTTSTTPTTSTSSTLSGTSNSTGSVTTPAGTSVPTSSTTTSSTSVSFQQAVDSAQNFFASKTIVKAVLLDGKRSTPVYLVNFSDGSKVVVDANSGTIVFSYDSATHTTTGTNPFADNDLESDSDQGKPHAIHANLGAYVSNDRGAQGEQHRD